MRSAIIISAILAAAASVVRADEYDDLGCYVGSMTRQQFYANKYAPSVQSTEADIERYRQGEAERIRRHNEWLASMTPKRPCKFKVGDVVFSNDFKQQFVVRKVFDAGGQWRLRSDVIGADVEILGTKNRTLDLFENECVADAAADVQFAPLVYMNPPHEVAKAEADGLRHEITELKQEILRLKTLIAHLQSK